MHAIIVYDAAGSSCEGQCGIDWRVKDNRILAADTVRERFGDGVTVEFTEGSAGEDTAEISEPRLVLNGKTRICGQFDIRQLCEAIETEREIES